MGRRHVRMHIHLTRIDCCHYCCIRPGSLPSLRSSGDSCHHLHIAAGEIDEEAKLEAERNIGQSNPQRVFQAHINRNFTGGTSRPDRHAKSTRNNIVFTDDARKLK